MTARWRTIPGSCISFLRTRKRSGHVSHPNSAVIVSLLSLAYGVVCIETVSISYLLPFISQSLALSNTQIGALIAVYWAAFAYSSFSISAIADRKYCHREYFCTCLLLFAALSPLSGLAGSFYELFFARMLMGCIEGPLMPLAQTITVFESSIERRGMNTGIVLNVGSGLLAGIIAPVCLVSIAENLGWRAGFFVTAIPGLLCALGAIVVLHDGPQPAVLLHSSDQVRRLGINELLRLKNVSLCVAGSCLSMAFGIIGASYVPLYFGSVRGFTPLQTGALIGVLGLSTLVLSVLLTALADRIGRKPIAVVGSALSVLGPLAAIYYSGPTAALIVVLFFCWSLTSTVSLFMSTIPSESIPAGSTSTVIGLMVAVSTIVGGAVFPMFAGWSADRWGLQAALFVQSGCAGAAAIFAWQLQETLPSRSACAPASD